MKKSKVILNRHAENLTFSAGNEILEEAEENAYLGQVVSAVPNRKKKSSVELIWAGGHSASAFK